MRPSRRGLRSVRSAGAAVLLIAASGLVGAGTVDAAVPTFEAPTATARLGDPLAFSVTVHAEARPVRVELVTSIPGSTVTSVSIAELSDQGGGTYRVSVEEESHVEPNTTIDYRFRAVMADGSDASSAAATTTVVDDRFEWRTKDGPIVHVHWYEGDDAFAQRAIDIGEAAITKASDLLGVTETEPVDFFIYASEDAFRDALGPGTRENVGGQANPQIRTLFALIEPSEIDSDWVGVVIPHELTHLVFASAIDNPYHDPPRWLNEGLAVYESQGYIAGDQAEVASAVRNGELIPLAGIAGLFPTSFGRFSLAYAESVSAVDYFIRSYGQEQLVSLITSYAGGVTDNEAFAAATGADLGAFDAAWMASLGAATPDVFGPEPAPPGPLPADWTAPLALVGVVGLALLPLLRLRRSPAR